MKTIKGAVQASHASHRSCGNRTKDHDWTREGEGGCESNPGVWSNGLKWWFHYHCRRCGLHRVLFEDEQNDVKKLTYTFPERWCAKCESKTCPCKRRPLRV